MELQDDIRIGHSGDALALLDQVLGENQLEPDVAKVLEAIRNAIERGIL
jgi:hypothetical protein